MNGLSILRVTRNAAAALALGAFSVASHSHAEETTHSALSLQTHFHGIGIAQEDPLRLYLATHHGLFEVSNTGMAKRISQTRDDFMGFSPHPTDPAVLFASGHPTDGGNLGVVVSTDRGRTWARRGDGAHGPSDYHQMTVSRVDADVMYGVYGTDLQSSRDGGRSWMVVRQIPDRVFSLAASANAAETIFAATPGGLLESTDGGRTWTTILAEASTSVAVTGDGQILVFTLDGRLLRGAEGEEKWNLVTSAFGNTLIIHLAAGAHDGQILAAVTYDAESKRQGIAVSRDGGATWSAPGAE